MKPEAEDVEYKSQFQNSKSEWLALIKTIVAMANTRGGIITISSIRDVNSTLLFDTAKIDDKVNIYISPRIHNITSSYESSNNSVTIFVPNSPSKPHIFIKDGAYENPNPPPQQKFEFYEGQMWVRHSGKNEKATKDDFDRMFKEKLDDFLTRINIIATQFPLSSKEVKLVEGDSNEAIPVTIRKEGEGLPVILEKVDPNIDYPYTAKTLGGLLGKNQNFIANTAKALALKSDMKYAISIKSSSGRVLVTKYSEETLNFLRDFFTRNPSYSPYKKEED